MKVILNGEPFETTRADSVTGLLEETGFGGREVAVVLNGEMIPAGARGAYRLSEGDHVELFRFVAGG